MVQPGDDDLVAGLPAAGERAADVQRERGHIVAEDDLLAAGGVEQLGYGSAGLVDDQVGLAAGGKGAPVVGVPAQVILVDAVERLLGDLGAAGIVEEDFGPVQRRELGADEIGIGMHYGPPGGMR